MERAHKSTVPRQSVLSGELYVLRNGNEAGIGVQYCAIARFYRRSSACSTRSNKRPTSAA